MAANIGLIGLAVMGENLALNLASKGFSVAVFNRTVARVDRFVQGRAADLPIYGAKSLLQLVESLEPPRRILMMVRAGTPVDELIGQLLPLLSPGDILIDGGNSHYADTIRRTALLKSRGLLYVGLGVSGGEEGALRGPSLMPGGAMEAWPHIRNILKAICARSEDGAPCCCWIGEDGAGHFVKMVHNGIEYGDMQLICEAYHMMRDCMGLSHADMSRAFRRWNEGELRSYLIEITGEILARPDADGTPLVERILDVAGQKGTGKWAATAALNQGAPLTMIGEAVFARCLSAAKEERIEASDAYEKAVIPFAGDHEALLEDLRKALLASKIVSYAQGFSLMRMAAKTHGWNLRYGDIALIWRGGCIIRSAFLGRIADAFERRQDLPSLLLDPVFRDTLRALTPAWRRTVAAAVQRGVPMPAMTSALSFFDGYTTRNLPANLLEAQRDFFGAHNYERIDQPRGQFFHTDWTGSGGDTAATTYNA